MSFVGALFIVAVEGTIAMDSGAGHLNDGLIAAWKLEGNASDNSGHGLDAMNHGVVFRSDGFCSFPGKGQWLEVADAPFLQLGTSDFSVAVWVNLDSASDDVLGDILSKYDPDTRRGFHLSVLNAPGLVSSHSNYRNVHFGLDGGSETPNWVDCGRPGNNQFVCGMAVYDGTLYVGTYECDGAGRVYKYSGGTEWIDCGAPDPANTVATLAVYRGTLYAGAMRYKAGGSALPDSQNQNPGGKVYRYEGGTEWTDSGALPDCDAAWAMTVCDGSLYAIPIYQQGMWKYEGGTKWTFCGTPGVRMFALGVFDGRLYGAGNEGNKTGGVYLYEGGTQWSKAGGQEGVDQVYSFSTFEGRLYAGTWPDAIVFRFEPPAAWANAGRLGQELEVMGMTVYNGKLYGGTLPLAEVYRYDGENRWTSTGRLDMTPDVKYRRAWSMAIFQGRLFCGTLPSGHVYSLNAGQNVTYDRVLGQGWHHLTAVRAGRTLSLYVDGKLEASAETESPVDISNLQPLKIGSGSNDYFNGLLRDVRLYGRALNPEEAAALASERP